MERNAQALIEKLSPVVDADSYRALHETRRWEIVRSLESYALYTVRAEVRERERAVEGRPAPLFEIDDYFLPEPGTTVCRVIDRFWTESHGGFWRYQGYSDKYTSATHCQYVERDVYYKCSLMRRCDAEGKRIGVRKRA